jgi:hypothetical protein
MFINTILASIVLMVLYILLFLDGTSGFSRLISVKEVQVASSLWKALIALDFMSGS